MLFLRNQCTFGEKACKITAFFLYDQIFLQFFTRKVSICEKSEENFKKVRQFFGHVKKKLYLCSPFCVKPL